MTRHGVWQCDVARHSMPRAAAAGQLSVHTRSSAPPSLYDVSTLCGVPVADTYLVGPQSCHRSSVQAVRNLFVMRLHAEWVRYVRACGVTLLFRSKSICAMRRRVKQRWTPSSCPLTLDRAEDTILQGHFRYGDSSACRVEGFLMTRPNLVTGKPEGTGFSPSTRYVQRRDSGISIRETFNMKRLRAARLLGWTIHDQSRSCGGL